MKQRLIEITLISIILLLIAFAVGCKEDEPESNESIQEFTELVGDILDNQDKIINLIEFLFDRIKRLEELHRPFDFNDLDFDALADEPEPNEPEEPRYYHPLDPRAYTCPKCYDGAKGTLCPGHYEPNEPECIVIEHPMLQEGYTFHIWEPNDISVVSLDFIPTWPEYIELEKDLWLDCRHKDDPNDFGSSYGYIMIEKGTRIYFKEDE